MKVLKVIHTLGQGGAENMFRWLAWGLMREGLEVTAAIPDKIAAFEKENWLEPALKELGIRYLLFNKNGSPSELLKNVSATITQAHPDIVHSHLLDSNFYCSLACLRCNVPHVCTEHGDIFFKPFPVSNFKYLVISILSNFIVCVSDSVREKASSKMPFHRKFRVIYNGIHVPEGQEFLFREEFNISRETLVVGNVGSLYEIKGQRFLVDAFSKFLSSHDEAKLVFVGTGAEEQNLRHQISALKIDDGKVVFAGRRGDVGNAMKAFDLYVQPSLSEGHPLAVLEAMSLGVPVVASAVGGLPELLCSGKYGSLVPPGSPDALYAAFVEFLSRPSDFQSKARSAQKYVREHFTIEKMASSYIELYEHALRKEQKSRPRR